VRKGLACGEQFARELSYHLGGHASVHFAVDHDGRCNAARAHAVHLFQGDPSIRRGIAGMNAEVSHQLAK